MTSIIPFISNEVFEPSDIKVMSDAYNMAMEGIYGFGHPNKIVEDIIATRIIALTKGGERDPRRSSAGWSPRSSAQIGTLIGFAAGVVQIIAGGPTRRHERMIVPAVAT